VTQNDKSERWKIIPSIPTHEVSDTGRVRRMVDAGNWKAGKILTPHTDRDGYTRVKIAGSARPVHPLICEAFNGPCPPGLICRHLNDIKSDMRPENLAWGTYIQNYDDARRNGRLYEQPKRFDRDEALRLYKIGLNQKEIGYWLRVSSRSIYYALENIIADVIRETPLLPDLT
jgi:hypothetical protein